MDDFLRKEFGGKPYEYKKLNGYDNLNYLLEVDNQKYILKPYNKSDELLHQLQAENDTLLQLPSNNQFPRPIAFKDGTYIKVYSEDGQEKIVRLNRKLHH